MICGGDVYWVDFNPARGGEIQKRRPAIVVSNDAALLTQNRVQVVPLTSNRARLPLGSIGLPRWRPSYGSG